METILIQNFKAIKNTAKREIKVANLTILMGEQATGKSTVAKLVYFFKKLPEIIWTEILTNSDIDETNFDSKISRSISLLFSYIFGSLKRLESFYILYTYSNNHQIFIRKDIENGKLIIQWPNEVFSINLKYPLYQIGQEINVLKDKYDDFSRRERERLEKVLIKSTKNIFGKEQNILYMPASRNTAVALEAYLVEVFSMIQRSAAITGSPYNSENEYIIIEFLRYIQFIKNRLKGGGFRDAIIKEDRDILTYELMEEVMKNIQNILIGEYGFKDQYDEKIKNSDGVLINLTDSSSGQQEAIRILQDIFLEILEDKPVFRVYEEPESHLSPVGQLGIIQLIAMLANRNPDNQIIIPTHTPYLLREVSNMMKASKIVKDNPELREEVSKILKPYYWLDMESVSAYQLTREGEIEDAKDEEYQMIDGELFDRVTNDISDQFDKLLSLQYE